MGLIGSVLGGLVNTAARVFGGNSGGGMSVKNQMKLQDHAHEQSMELAEKQNQWELDRMGLQANYNKEAADYSQQLAKDMWEYTGIGGQIRQMKENNINPALMYGGGGGGGQSTSGGSMQGVTAIQPMGLSVAIQARQQAAQAELAEAQARKLDTETAQMKTIGIAQSIAGIVQTIAQTGLIGEQKTKLKADVEQIGKTVEQLNANIDSIRENTELVKFQNRINKLLENSFKYEADGREYNFEDVIISKFYKEFLTNNLRMDKEQVEYLNEKGIAERLAKDLDKIVEGKLNEVSISENTIKKLKSEVDRNNWELKNDKALGDIIEEIGGDSKYSKLLMLVINRLIQK